jgi:hypothetical protein
LLSTALISNRRLVLFGRDQLSADIGKLIFDILSDHIRQAAVTSIRAAISIESGTGPP